MMMKNSLVIVVLFAGFQLNAGNGARISKEEYVSKWSRIAMEEMMRHNIPASITLAQGILESASGNSDLAVQGNNHFGIKCHDWTGKKMYKDDDKKNECFRVYSNAEESFVDHSLFLTGRSRYAKLFTYDKTDYKSWAKGLKEAGYATNPKYPDLLIDIIEQLNLTQYDNAGGKDLFSIADLTGKKKDDSVNSSSTSSSKSPQTVVITESAHAVYNHTNKVKYVVVKKGDTYYRIAKEFGLSLRQLYRYNDFEPNKDLLEVGDIVNIYPKRAKGKQKSVKCAEQKTLRQISQEEGIRLSSLMKMNNITSEDAIVEKGEKIILR